MAGEIVHIELPSSDFARSAAFYLKVFGWKTDGVQSGGHLLFDLPGGVQGSWIRDALAQAPGPVPFVAVSDLDQALAEAERQGGRILVRRLTLPNRGVFGLLADCDGNVIGVLSARGASSSPASAPAAASKPSETGGGKAAATKTSDKGKPSAKTAGKEVAKDIAKKAPTRKR